MLQQPLKRLVSWLPAGFIEGIVAWRQRSPVVGRVLEPLASALRQGVVVIPTGEAAGMRIDANGENASYALGTMEPLVQEVFAQHIGPGSVVYDIGANIGFFTLVAGKLVGAAGYVYAFEPVAATADRLAANVALNPRLQVDILRVGVGREAGSATLVTTDLSQTASLVLRGEGESGGERIEVVALDDLVQAGRLKPPTFVKMDIEGAEVDALAGMRHIVEIHRPVILCEVHGTHDAVADLFETHGYDVSVVESHNPLREAPDLVHALAVSRSRPTGA